MSSLFFPSYSIVWRKNAVKQIKQIPKSYQQKIIDQIDGLKKDKENLKIKKLKGGSNLFRLRVGNYRIVFQISKEKKLIIIAAIAHRKEIYSLLNFMNFEDQ